jgi:phenylacetate-CoA ligase
LGDVAVRSSSPCDCGRGFSVLSEIQGRIEDVLWLSDHRFVHPRAVWEVLKASEGLIRFQLVQHAPDRYALRLLTVSREAFDAIAAAALPRLRMLLDGASIDAVAVAGLGIGDEAKFRAVVTLPRRQDHVMPDGPLE